MEVALSTVGTFTMEKGGEFLFEKLKEYARGVIKKGKLIRVIKKEVSFLFNNEKNRDFFNSALYNIFDDSNIRKIVEKIVDSNGFDFVDIFLREIEKNLDGSELDYTTTKRIKNVLIINLIGYLKKKDPDFYKNYITDQMYQKQINQGKDIKTLLDVDKKIYQFLKSPQYYNIYSYEKDLKKSTVPSIDLGFFEQQDDSLLNYIKIKMEKKENMFFWGLSKHEILYTLLWAFKKIDTDAFVFHNKEDWEKCKNSDFNGMILIPFFDLDEVSASIPNNINVFIHEQGNYTNNEDVFRIHIREHDFVVDKMKEFTGDYQKADDLINDSNGFFYPLMESIFKNGTINKHYKVDTHHIKAVAIAILINQWTEDDADKKFIESLYEGSYDAFLDSIYPYMHDAKRDLTNNINPIFVRKNSKYGFNDVISVVSQQKSFKDLVSIVSESVWNIYYSKLEVLFNNEIIISKEMVEGILKTLAMLSCNQNLNLMNTPKINLIIDKYLNYVYDNDGWISFSDSVCLVIEINPKKTLEYINMAIDNEKTAFINLFDKNSGDYTSYNKYCSYIFALEKIVQLEDYYLEAIDILFKLNDFGFEYSISNSPRQTLNSIFCPWLNVSCLMEKAKIDLLNKSIKKYKRAYLVAYDNMPNKHSSVCGFTHLKYRKYSIIDSKVPLSVICECYNNYLEVFINNCVDNKLLIDFVDEMKDFPFDALNKIEGKLLMLINQMPENQRACFKNELRSLIYECKYFTSWEISKEVILWFEKMLSNIIFDVKEYDYTYIFVDDFSFPISNPDPYDTDNCHANNDKKAEKERLEKIKEFTENGLSLEKLLGINDRFEIGYYIDLLSKEKSIKRKLKFLYEKSINKRIIIAYLISLRSNDKVYYKAIDCLINDLLADEKIIADALAYHPVDDGFLKYCDNLNENILSLLWMKRVNHYSNITISQIEKVLGCIVKHGNISAYIKFLMDVSKYITNDKIYELMSTVDRDFIEKKTEIDYDLGYQLDKMFKLVYPLAISKKEHIDLFAYLELHFSDILEHNNLRFLKYIACHDPDFYYDLVINVYNKKYDARISRLYFNFYFCPGYFDGKFDGTVFTNWMGKFTSLMSDKKEKEMLPHVVGKLLAYSPSYNSDLPLEKPVLDYIEENYSKSLLSSFACAELNKRGIHSLTGGKEEKEYSKKYKGIASILKKEGYFNSSHIYEAISGDYEWQSEYDAYRAKFE